MNYPIEKQKPHNPLRARLHEIIFEADTAAGRFFDLALIWSILISVAAVMLDSVAAVRAQFGPVLTVIEWFFTILFTLEYLLRLWCIGKPLRYATSFFGLVDLLAILPTFLSLVMPGSRYLLVIRILRVLRIFRVLKLMQYLNEAQLMIRALRAAGHKIAVFFATVMTLVVIFGSVMYIVEGEAHGFTSIPRSIYWAIVTMTTVGYGDISPQTAVGQTIAAIVMLIGFTIIAVPTGIVASEMSRSQRRAVSTQVSTQVCTECAAEGHDADARHCKMCGAKI
ncbi:MAG: ion transporter [Candidatus Krumholzibacteria bacterium]|nr:ion transporter [Candidatus Krumholzibacteria bacterium]